MPVPTSSRYEQLFSPPSMMPTPSRSSHIRTPSNNTGYSPTVTSVSNQPKLNVVSRVAIEGKAKKGQEGASIRMFLKISLPVDSVTPGSTIPLFPEENVKIHASQVHPLDQNGVPYNFSTSVSPLLHDAAKALNLPLRSQENFNTTFGLTKPNGNSTASRSLKPENGESVSPIDVQYTGHILVSGYSISFVTPKVFLSSRSNQSDTEESVVRTPANGNVNRRRRQSIGERNQIFFMAAIDMWVPFLSKPPRSPYLLSIPTPRCLHNHIKLRIFPPPTNTSSSFASLSSVEDDNAAWDLISEPHVTRIASSRSSRSNTHFADDESSDSSATNVIDNCVIQGTFPTAEHIKIRWAKPMRMLNIPGDESGRRRVGVEDAKGEMTCKVRGKGTSSSNPDVEGILMDIEYKGQCSGIWFPGVATLLGLDVGLEAKGCDISWPQGFPTQWEVSGSAGYTGFDHGSFTAPSTIDSRAPSMESSVFRPSGIASQESTASSYSNARTSASSASLLRAPLPAHNVADYSFEGSNDTMSSTLSPGAASSMASLTVPSISSLSQPKTHSPASPITLHLDINELQPPIKNVFNLRITGTILLTSRTTLARINSLNGSNSSASGKHAEQEPVMLPRFTILAADSESTSTIIRNESNGILVEVFNPNGDIHQDPQTRKTILQKNGFTRCGEDGGRISLKYSVETRHPSSSNGGARPSNRPRTPSNTMNRVSSNSNLPRTILSTRSKRDGPPIIPWVKANVTALAPDTDMFPTGYAITLTLPTPAGLESEWLEFGIANASLMNNQDLHSKSVQRKIHIICASLDGVPVKAETSKASTAGLDAVTGVSQFEDIGGKNWLCWGKVNVGSSTGGNITIDYIVKEQDIALERGKNRANESSAFDILLPTFFVSVARLEVFIDSIPGLEIASLRSNFDYHYSLPKGNRLLRFSVDEYSQPQLSLTIQKPNAKRGTHGSGFNRYIALTWIMLLVVVFLMYHIMLDMHKLHSVQNTRLDQVDVWTDLPTFTVTTTVYGNSETKQWSEISSAIIQPTNSHTPSLTKITTTKPILTYSSPTNDPITTFTNNALPTSTTPQHEPMKETSLTHTSLQSVLETYGLVPLKDFFSLFQNDQSNVLIKVSDKIVGTMQVVWNIFRKVYHYPLDPP